MHNGVDASLYYYKNLNTGNCAGERAKEDENSPKVYLNYTEMLKGWGNDSGVVWSWREYYTVVCRRT